MVVNNTVNTIPYTSPTDIVWISVLCILLFVGIVAFLIWKMAPKYIEKGPEERPKLLTYIALILIILAIILLELNGILSTEHCATLLAAIAGYVLGRAGQKQVITTKPGEMSIKTEPVAKSPQNDSKNVEDSNENVQGKDSA